MDIIKALNTRYSTKVFDKNKKISKEDLEKIETILQLSPSSTNIQPWHFILAESDDAKAKVAKASQGFFSFNEKKVTDSSLVVIFASKTDVDEDYLVHINETEDKDKRYANSEIKETNHKARSTFTQFHKEKYNDLQTWFDKQLYLNLGNFLVSVAALGIDAVPMEGLEMNILDDEFNLTQKGFASKVVVALGYHSDDDFNASLPKSRLDKDEIIEKF
ncbi:MAG: oxygen-insensitive NAD(P)H nitroreductase [Sphaerochaetaceae bacterium]|nr:oxygen-insensitive NAD(P)H nitroreductase [Sphaerochaetaceae bacterium]MDC7236200.1 oxygen-insensitive NAD(P)H nitroreductase [Sphaerochaetaceae bacterium]MDC7250924.1 oxygen-insensitive NAD(P)H nitroreductase [Sphaerochaetaceae bacterium]